MELPKYRGFAIVLPFEARGERVEGKITTNKWDPKEICVKTKWYTGSERIAISGPVFLCE